MARRQLNVTSGVGIALFVLTSLAINLQHNAQLKSTNTTAVKEITDLCTRLAKSTDQSSAVTTVLQNRHGATYPEVKTETEFTLDFDTYAESWKKDYPGGASAGVKTMQNLRNATPKILSEFNVTYGDPYEKIKLVIAYDRNLKSDSELNPAGDNSQEELYIPKSNLLILGGNDQGVNETTFIRGLAAAYNDGAIAVPIYNYGLTSSAAEITAQKLGYLKDLPVHYTGADHPILAGNLGLISTNSNQTIIDERKSAATALFTEIETQNPQFFKTFRRYISISGFFAKAKESPTSFASRLFSDSACAELTLEPQKNVLRQYLEEMELILAVTAKPYQANKKTNPLLAITNNTGVYTDVNIDTNNNKVQVRSLFRPASISQALFTLVDQDNQEPTAKESTVKLPQIASWAKNVDTNNQKQLGELSAQLEKPADRVELTVSQKIGAETVTSQTIELKPLAKTESFGVFLDSSPEYLLNVLHLTGEYSGTLTLKLSAFKSDFIATPESVCSGWLWRRCWPHGLKAKPSTYHDDRIFNLTFEKGRVKTLDLVR